MAGAALASPPPWARHGPLPCAAIVEKKDLPGLGRNKKVEKPPTCTMIRSLFALALLVPTIAWECKDKSADCPQWKQNMNGDCKGQDYGYMLANCPVTCEICTEAEEAWKKEEEERKKNPTYEPEDSKVVVLDADSIDGTDLHTVSPSPHLTLLISRPRLCQ
jgi:hypothetical protein